MYVTVIADGMTVIEDGMTVIWKQCVPVIAGGMTVMMEHVCDRYSGWHDCHAAACMGLS